MPQLIAGNATLRARSTAARSKRRAVGRRQELGLAVAATAPDRPHRVDDDPCRQVAGARDDRRAGRAAAVAVALPQLAHDARTGRAMDSPIDASTAGQSTIGSVHDGIHSHTT